MSAMTELEAMEAELMAQIGAAADDSALEAIRVAAIGKKGSVSEKMKTLGAMSADERQTMGPKLNALKNTVTDAINARKHQMEDAALNARLASETLDITLPVRTAPQSAGRIHPVSQVIDEITAIFSDMGFAIAEGPDVETDFNNFTALNIPLDHPARQDHDTFYLTPDVEGNRKVLRTHTSPVQVRTMTSQTPPIRVVCPGRTYRSDSDQTHTPMFHQVEGLVIDKSSNMSHLKGVLEAFCKAFFEVEQVNLRFRASYFPFTEPSMEVDVQCERKGGELLIGQGDGWLEILGCGMVHPNVLSNCGIDPNEYQGFAWGMGIDRIAMLKYGMPDLRAFFDNDLRWLKHYGFPPLDIPSLAGGLSA